MCLQKNNWNMYIFLYPTLSLGSYSYEEEPNDWQGGRGVNKLGIYFLQKTNAGSSRGISAVSFPFWKKHFSP